MSPLRWTTKSTRNLAAELTRQGHRAGAGAVGDLLRAEGFSLQGNAKTIEGQRHPDRNAQFRYINEQVKAHQGTADPVISVDTKKKGLAGEFKNGGREWRPKGQPAATRTHDFPGDSAGKAVPYGVYDLTTDAGWVSVGTDHDTAAFAVESIRRWWKAAGRAEYPQARRLLITADAGGSNGYRTRAWKAELAALAMETGLEITCCHFPPGTSKWNKVEHRLFSHITMNWRRRPLTSHEVIVQTIAATTTRTGLRVRAELDTSAYATKVKLSDRQMDALPLTRHNWHGDWNYTLRSEAYDQAAGAPYPFHQPSPDLAWLAHPGLTGLPAQQWDALITTLMILHDQQREAGPDKRRGHRPRLTAPGTGRRPVLTLADRLLATVLHQLLDKAGHAIQPGPHRLANLDDLYSLATSEGITISSEIKTAC
jgi:Rhodopirellula transposase DDE domain